jgi:pimeloyl-ACP methyl ester carboxylesterase
LRLSLCDDVDGDSRTCTPSRRRVVDGTRLHTWRNDGTGPPEVLSTGWAPHPRRGPGSRTPVVALTSLDGTIAGSVARSGRLIHHELRVEDHADDLIAVMDAAGQSRPVIIGWSLGVYVAFAVAPPPARPGWSG